MIKNHFYEKKGPYPLNEIVKTISCDNTFVNKNNIEIHGLESLSNATIKDITFLNSQKYKNFSLKTKAVACITTLNLAKFLPEECIKLNVKNVLFAVTQASKMFYPNADVDLPDETLQESLMEEEEEQPEQEPEENEENGNKIEGIYTLHCNQNSINKTIR